MKKYLLFLLLSITILYTNAQESFNILSYGALPISANNASAIQEAIDACTAAGGGEVVIPTGVFISGTIILKSNVTLRLMPGAVLMGSLSLDDYPEIVNQTFKSIIDGGCQRSLIYAEGADNLRITGSGIINGNGSLPPFQGADSEDRPFAVRLVSCNNLRVDSVTMMESGFWMMHILNCDSVSVNAITIFNHGNSNNDGINLDCVKNAWVRNCIVDSSDDGIAIKSTGNKYTENILVEDCTLRTLARGIKIGTESVGGFRNIIIRNCNCDASVLSNPLVLPGQSGFSIN